jgi:hypothetical protein
MSFQSKRQMKLKLVSFSYILHNSKPNISRKCMQCIVLEINNINCRNHGSRAELMYTHTLSSVQVMASRHVLITQ